MTSNVTKISLMGSWLFLSVLMLGMSWGGVVPPATTMNDEVDNGLDSVSGLDEVSEDEVYPMPDEKPTIDLGVDSADELVGMRQADKKFYKTDEGVRAYITAGPMHYLDADSRWQDINLNLETSDRGWIVEENTFVTTFAEDIHHGVGIHDESFGSEPIRIGIDPQIVLTDPGMMGTTPYEDLAPPVHVPTPRTGGNTIRYPMYESVDLEYMVTPTTVKQNLVFEHMPNLPDSQQKWIGLKERMVIPSNSALYDGYDLIDDGWYETDRGLEIRDRVTGEMIAEIQSPIISSLQDPSQAVRGKYFIQVTGPLVEITTGVPIEWLQQEDLLYPVAIDPTVIVKGLDSGYAMKYGYSNYYGWGSKYAQVYRNDWTSGYCRGLQSSYSWPRDTCAAGSSYLFYHYNVWAKFDLKNTMLPQATINSATLSTYVPYANQGLKTKYKMDTAILRTCQGSWNSWTNPSVVCSSNAALLDPDNFQGYSSSMSGNPMKMLTSTENSPTSAYVKHPSGTGWKNMTFSTSGANELATRASNTGSDTWVGLGIRVSKNDTQPWYNICNVGSRDYRCGGKQMVLILDWSGGVDNNAPDLKFIPYAGDTYRTGARTLYMTAADVSGVDTSSGNEPRIYYRENNSGTWNSAIISDVPDTRMNQFPSYGFGSLVPWMAGTIPEHSVGATVEYFVAMQDAHTNKNLATSPSGGGGDITTVTDPSNVPSTLHSYTILDTTLASTSDHKWIVNVDGANQMYNARYDAKNYYKQQMTMWEGTNEIVWEFDSTDCGYCFEADDSTYWESPNWNMKHDSSTTTTRSTSASYSSSSYVVNYPGEISRAGPSQNILYYYNADEGQWGIANIDDTASIHEPTNKGQYRYYVTQTGGSSWTYARDDGRSHTSTWSFYNKAIPVRVGSTDFSGKFGTKTVGQSYSSHDFTHLCINSNGFSYFRKSSSTLPGCTHYYYYGYQKTGGNNYQYRWNGWTHGSHGYNGRFTPDWEIYSRVAPIKPVPDTFEPLLQDISVLGDSYVATKRKVYATIADDGDPPTGLDTSSPPKLTYSAVYGMAQDFGTSCGLATTAGSVIVNEFNAVDSGQTLSGTDPHWGQVAGNGGDWIELMVVGSNGASNVDMRGWTIEVDDNGDGSVDSTIELNSDMNWCAVPSGTILTFTEDDTLSGGLATWINKTVENTWAWSNYHVGDGTHFKPTSATSFTVDDQNTDIEIKDMNGASISSMSGGTAATNAQAVLNDVADLTTAQSYGATSSSTFGALNNLTSSGTQDTSNLRTGAIIVSNMIPTKGTVSSCAQVTCEWVSVIPEMARGSTITYNVSATDASIATSGKNTAWSADMSYHIGTPTKVFVVEWHHQGAGYSSNDWISYQARFYDVTNEVEFEYDTDSEAYYDSHTIGYQDDTRNYGETIKRTWTFTYSRSLPIGNNYRISTVGQTDHSYEAYDLGMDELKNYDEVMRGDGSGWPYAYYCYYYAYYYYDYYKRCGDNVEMPDDFEFDWFGDTMSKANGYSMDIWRFGGLSFTTNDYQCNRSWENPTTYGLRLCGSPWNLDYYTLPTTQNNNPPNLVAPFWSGYGSYYCWYSGDRECSIRTKLIPFEGAGLDVSADITKDTIWDKEMSPIRVKPTNGNFLSVAANLQIEPGTTILVEPGKGISFDGSSCIQLDAEGTAAEPIKFSTLEPGRDWKGLAFTSPSSGCTAKQQADRHNFQHVDFEFAETAVKAGSRHDGSGTSTAGDVGSIGFSDVTFTNVGTAIEHGSGANTAISLTNANFDKVDKSCLKAPDGADVVIRDSSFTSCNQDGGANDGVIRITGTGSTLSLENVDVVDANVNVITGTEVSDLWISNMTVSTNTIATRQTGAVIDFNSAASISDVYINNFDVSAAFTNGITDVNPTASLEIYGITLADVSTDGINLGDTALSGPSGLSATMEYVNVTGASGHALSLTRVAPSSLEHIDLSNTGDGLQFFGISPSNAVVSAMDVTAAQLKMSDACGWNVRVSDFALALSGGDGKIIADTSASCGGNLLEAVGGVMSETSGNGNVLQASDGGQLVVADVIIGSQVNTFGASFNEVGSANTGASLMVIHVNISDAGSGMFRCNDNTGHISANCVFTLDSGQGSEYYVGGLVYAHVWRDMAFIGQSATKPMADQSVYATSGTTGSVNSTLSSISPALSPIGSVISDANGDARVWIITEKVDNSGTTTYSHHNIEAVGSGGSGGVWDDSVRPDGSVTIQMDSAPMDFQSAMTCSDIKADSSFTEKVPGHYLIEGANMTITDSFTLDGCILEVNGGNINMNSTGSKTTRIAITDGGELRLPGDVLLGAKNSQYGWDFDVVLGTVTVTRSTIKDVLAEVGCNCGFTIGDGSVLALDAATILGAQASSTDVATVSIDGGSMTSIGASKITNTAQTGTALRIESATPVLDQITLEDAAIGLKLLRAAPTVNAFTITGTTTGVDVEGSMTLPTLYRSTAISGMSGWKHYSVDLTSLAKSNDYVQVGAKIVMDAGTNGLWGYSYAGDYLAFDKMYYNVGLNGNAAEPLRPGNQGATYAASGSTIDTYHKYNPYYRCGNGFSYSYIKDWGGNPYTYNYYLPKYTNSSMSNSPYAAFNYSLEEIEGQSLNYYYYVQMYWYSHRYSYYFNGQYQLSSNSNDPGNGWDTTGVNYNYYWYRQNYASGACRAYGYFQNQNQGYEYHMSAPIVKTGRGDISEYTFEFDFYHRGSDLFEDRMEFVAKSGDSEANLMNSKWVREFGRASMSNGQITGATDGIVLNGNNAVVTMNTVTVSSPTNSGLKTLGNVNSVIDGLTVSGGNYGVLIDSTSNGALSLPGVSLSGQSLAGLYLDSNFQLTFTGSIGNSGGAAIKTGSSDTGGWEWDSLTIANNAIGMEFTGTGANKITNPTFSGNTKDIVVSSATDVTVLDGTIDMGLVDVTHGNGIVRRGYSVEFSVLKPDTDPFTQGAEVYLLTDRGEVAGHATSDSLGMATGFEKITEEKTQSGGLVALTLSAYEVVALGPFDDSGDVRDWRYVRQANLPLTSTGKDTISITFNAAIDAIVCNNWSDNECDADWSTSTGNQYGNSAQAFGAMSLPIADGGTGKAGDWNGAALMWNTDYLYTPSNDIELQLDNTTIFVQPGINAYQRLTRMYVDYQNSAGIHMHNATIIVLGDTGGSGDSYGISFGDPWNALNPIITNTTIIGLSGISQGEPYNWYGQKAERFVVDGNTFVSRVQDANIYYQYRYGINFAEPDGGQISDNTMIGFDYPIRISRASNYYYQQPADYGPDGVVVDGNVLIDSEEYGIYFEGYSYMDGGTVSNNVMRGSTSPNYGLYINDGYSNNLVVDGNEFNHGEQPIYVNRVTDVTINGNTIFGDSNTNHYGIYMGLSNGNVTGNTLTDADGGIYVNTIRNGQDIWITDNTITQSGRQVVGGYGIWVRNCAGGTIHAADNDVSVWHQAFDAQNCDVIDERSSYDSGAGSGLYSDQVGYELSGSNLDVKLYGVSISGFEDGLVMSGGDLELGRNTQIKSKNTAVELTNGADLSVGRSDPQTHIIELSDTGMSPNAPYLAAGDSVTFVNTGSHNLSVNETSGSLFATTSVEWNWPSPVITCMGLNLTMMDTYGDGNEGLGGAIREKGTTNTVLTVPGYDWGKIVTMGPFDAKTSTDYVFEYESDYWPEETSWELTDDSGNVVLAGDVEDLPMDIRFSCGEPKATPEQTMTINTEIHKSYQVEVRNEAGVLQYTGSLQVLDTLGGAYLEATGAGSTALVVSSSTSDIDADYVSVKADTGIDVDGVTGFRFSHVNADSTTGLVMRGGAEGHLENITWGSGITTQIDAQANAELFVINGSLEGDDPTSTPPVTGKLSVAGTAVIYEGNLLGVDVTYMGNPTKNVALLLQSSDRQQADYVSPAWRKSISVNTPADKGSMDDWMGQVPTDWVRPGVVSGGPAIGTRMKSVNYETDSISTLWTTWDSTTLYFALQGHDLTGGEDFIMYFDTTFGGSNAGYSAGDGQSHVMPFAADYRLHLSSDGSTKSLMVFGGSSWSSVTGCSGFDAHWGRETSDATSNVTELAVPFDCIGNLGWQDSGAARVVAFTQNDGTNAVSAVHPAGNTLVGSGGETFDEAISVRFAADKEDSLSQASMRNHLLIYRTYLGSAVPQGENTQWDVTVKDFREENWDSSNSGISMDTSKILQIDIKRARPLIVGIIGAQELVEDQGNYVLNLTALGQDLQDSSDKLMWSAVHESAYSGSPVNVVVVGHDLILSTRPNQFGDHLMTLTVEDLDGLTREHPLRINVTNVNDAPVICDLNKIDCAESIVFGMGSGSSNIQYEGQMIELNLDLGTSANSTNGNYFDSFIVDMLNEQHAGASHNNELAPQNYNWSVSLDSQCNAINLQYSEFQPLVGGLWEKSPKVKIWENDQNEVGGVCSITLNLTDRASVNEWAEEYLVNFTLRPTNDLPEIGDPSDGTLLATESGTVLDQVVDNEWSWVFEEDTTNTDDLTIDLSQIGTDVDSLKLNSTGSWVSDPTQLYWTVHNEETSSRRCDYWNYFHVVDAQTGTRDMITSGKMKLNLVPDANTDGKELDALYDSEIHQSMPTHDGNPVNYCTIRLKLHDSATDPGFYAPLNAAYEQGESDVLVRIRISNVDEPVPDYTFEPQSVRFGISQAVLEGTPVPVSIGIMNNDSVSSGVYAYPHDLVVYIYGNGTRTAQEVCDVIDRADVPKAGGASVSAECWVTRENLATYQDQSGNEIDQQWIWFRIDVKTWEVERHFDNVTGLVTQIESTPPVESDDFLVDLEDSDWTNNVVSHTDASQRSKSSMLPKIVRPLASVASVPSFAPTFVSVAIAGLAVALIRRGPSGRDEEEESMVEDDEAVSPVIATILMVAVTVVLAGVLYVWAGSLADTSAKAEPALIWQTDFNTGDAEQANYFFSITVTQSGDDIRMSQMRVELVDGDGTIYGQDLQNRSIYGVAPSSQAPDARSLIVFNDKQVVDSNGNYFTGFGQGDVIYVRMYNPDNGGSPLGGSSPAQLNVIFDGPVQKSLAKFQLNTNADGGNINPSIKQV